MPARRARGFAQTADQRVVGAVSFMGWFRRDGGGGLGRRLAVTLGGDAWRFLAKMPHARFCSVRCRVASYRKDGAGCLADQAASSVAADEILRSDRRVAAQLDIDPGVVLREAHHLAATKGRDPELTDPVSKDGSRSLCHSASP